MENNIFEKDGQKYVKVGDKAIPFSDYDDDGKPIIKAVPHVTEYPDGRKDVTMKIQCLTISAKKE